MSNSATVKDLLIRMTLDAGGFKSEVQTAKSELKLLRAEYKETASADGMENVGKALLDKLTEQKEAAERLVQAYKKGLEDVTAELEKAPAGSQKESRLTQSAADIASKLSNAQTSVNQLQDQINNFKIDRIATAAETAASTINALKLGIGDLLNGFGETADSADAVNVRREAALTQATKNVEDAHQTKKDLDALNNGLREMTTRIPQTYEQLSALLGVGATLGVPYEHLLNFVEVMAKLNTATNVDGEAGAQAMAQFLNITEKGYDNLDRVGATLTELGNNSATTEQSIIEMAHRASTGLSTVGMGAADILALSAAISSVGIEAQAGGSSISKLGITMDKAAKVGASQIDRLLKEGGDYKSIYEMYAALDAEGTKGWHGLEEALGMTASDTKALMNSALAAERFSAAMGMTVDQFSAGWNQDSANTMLSFFRTLGSMNGTEAGENMLWVMDQLGIKEIRQSNMVRALANNWELYADMLQLGRDAYDQNIALENEAQRAFGTTESQRVMNANKEQNALEAMGQTVTAMRQPFDDFFADLKQWYADWPSWAQTAVGAVSELMGGAGDVLDFMGDMAFNALNISKAIQMLSQTGAGAKLLKAGKTVGKGALGVTAVGAGVLGFVELAKYLGEMSDQTGKISQDLAGLKINIDPQSKDAALQAIAEVQGAVDRLNGADPEQAAKYDATSRVVQMGYGTSSMFGTALAWEQQKAEKNIEGIYAAYGEKINAEENALLAAQSEDDRAVIQGRIQALEAAMQSEVASARTAWSETLSALFAGAVQQAGESDTLKTVGEKYNLLRDVYEGWSKWNANPSNFQYGGAGQALQDRMSEFGLSLLDDHARYDFSAAASQLYASLAEDVKKVAGDGGLMSILSSSLEAGAFDQADASALSGSLLALLQAMDIKQIGEQNANDWRDIGKYSMGGLAQGITDANGNPIGAAEDASQSVIDAAKAVFDSHSPSRVFEGIGLDLDAGLAQGILAGIPDTVSAVQALGQAVAAAAAKQAALIAAAMTVIAPAPRYASGGSAASGAASGAARGGSNVTNNFTFNGGTATQTQGVKALAREITTLQKRANASVGQV